LGRHAAEALAIVDKIADPAIKAGVRTAIDRNLVPAASERQYPGHFTITADGGGYGSESTWPGLDSWQMAGAYLRLGQTRVVLDYFEFVRASQRKDGNIPFAILPGSTRSDGMWLAGLKYPDDLFTYTPPKRDGLPASSQQPRQWIGLFGHWQPKANPISTLAATCYLLTAAEIFDATRSETWVKERLASIEAAARHLLSRRTDNGLIGGSGFYIELPPRHGWDGVTQCYVAHAFGELARLFDAVGDAASAAAWRGHADELAARFVSTFWQGDHFAEYVHADRGLVDSHGLSDVNWAAVAFGLADEKHLRSLWPKLLAEPAFWWGGMPTQLVTRPFSYEKWEEHEKLPFGAPALKDVAAMGRVWQLEALACRRMNAKRRLVESTRLVCNAARDGYWSERYQAQPDGTSVPAGAGKYCEYPAVIVRTVLDNAAWFCS
jgi:hypothetical protein